MPLNVKELIVVLAIAAMVFFWAKPIALLFSPPADFSRRRNVWLTLTAAAFLSPNFWIFAAVAIPVLLFAGRRDSNPSALYVFLLHIIPPMSVTVPMVGMSFLFTADNYLLLSFFVMVPAALRLRRSTGTDRIRAIDLMDFCLIAFGLLSAIFFVRPLTPDGNLIALTLTDCLRRAFVFFFSIIVPYYVISRSSCRRQALLDILSAFMLSCAIQAAIGVFEAARHWLLYGEIADRWGVGISFSLYVARGESLRAMASTGHSLVLGYLLAIASGVWLYLKSYVNSKLSRVLVTVLLWLGLLAAYSRGPWIGAVCIYLAFAAFGPNPASKLFNTLALGAVAAVLLSLSPLQNRIVSVLPFLGGTVDSQNVAYRQQLFDRSWQIIQDSPLFGDTDALLKMQDLRQGQGIIDLVNSYLQILLNDGFVGLALFLTFILVGIVKAWATSRQFVAEDADLATLGATIVSCILGTLLMMVDGSFGTGLEKLFYILAALAAAYAYLGRSRTAVKDASMNAAQMRSVMDSRPNPL